MEEIITKQPKLLEKIGQEVQVVIFDDNGIVHYVNEQYTSITGFKSDEVVGKMYSLFYAESLTRNLVQEIWQKIRSGKSWHGAVKKNCKDDSEFWENITIIPFLDDDSISYRYISLGMRVDKITEVETNLDMALKDSFDETIKYLENTIFKYKETPDGRIIFTLSEGKISEKTGFKTDIIKGREITEFFPSEVAPIMKENFRVALEGEPNKFEMRLMGTDFLVHSSPIFEDGKVKEVVGTAIDITEQKKAESAIQYLAFHDPLTNLLNRTSFYKELADTLKFAKENDETFAVLYLDLDRFKNVNDTFGHHKGDQLLVAVSERLQEVVADDGKIARLGGDEYAIILPNRSVEETEVIVKKLLSRAKAPYTFDNIELRVTPSIGIAIYPRDGQNEEILLNNADHAMYYAKNQGRNNYHFYTEDIETELSRRREIENDMLIALKEEQFVLYYQPQVNLTTKEVVGAEALIRWEHPEKGLISPLDFVPLAEENGLIIPIGEWVLKTAAAQNKAWQDAGREPITISVNVSANQFMKSDFIDVVKRVLEETGLAPDCLELEITESMTMKEIYVSEILQPLREMGVKVSIDDFGTGYSSLHYLRSLPINKLKIDRSFIQNNDSKNQAIVKTIISLAKNLDMDVIAEGIEMEEHAQFLKEESCNLGQGYLFSRPLPKEKLEELYPIKSH